MSVPGSFERKRNPVLASQSFSVRRNLWCWGGGGAVRVDETYSRTVAFRLSTGADWRAIGAWPSSVLSGPIIGTDVIKVLEDRFKILI